MNVGTFPANASRIEALIAAGDTALQNFERDTRGLYGIEYLLYSADAAAVVAAFSGPSGADRCAYLRSIVRRMEQEVDTVHAQWVGGYAENFASRNGTDAGSGTSQLFNAMNMAFELVKNYKLGLPLGLRAGQSGPEPTKVEAFYSHLSVSLSQRQFNAVMRVWEGTTTSDESIPGFAEYLEHVPNGERLIADTRAQHQAVLTAGAAVSTSVPLSEQVVSNPSPATAWHTEMQKLTRYLKSELSSLTGLAITYASGDGD
jgi:predicted lipoprotein